MFRAILNGVHERGGGGVLLVRGEECAYCFPEDFGNDEFRYGLKKTLAMTAAQNFFFVVKQEQDAMHVLSYPRERVFREVREAMDTTTTTRRDDETRAVHGGDDAANASDDSHAQDTAVSAQCRVDVDEGPSRRAVVAGETRDAGASRRDDIVRDAAAGMTPGTSPSGP